MSSDCVKTPDVGTEYAEYAKSYTDFHLPVVERYIVTVALTYTVT